MFNEPDKLDDRYKAGLQKFCKQQPALTLEKMLEPGFLIWEAHSSILGHYCFIWGGQCYKVSSYGDLPEARNPADYPDYADARAYRFFRHYNDGERHLDGTHPGLTPTKVVLMDGDWVCIYCARKAKPLQANHHRMGSMSSDSWFYRTTGYGCCCKGSCDERDAAQELKEAQKKAHEILDAARAKFPKPNLLALRDRRVQHLKRDDRLTLEDLVDHKQGSTVVADEPDGDFP